jgi:GAF domain-containing protein
MVGPIDVASALAEAARHLQDPQDLDGTLQTILSVARDSMPEIDHAGISLGHRDGRVVTRAKTDDVVAQLDDLQYEFGEGPCLHAMHTATTIVVAHARHEQRWPRFIRSAVPLGLRSQLGVRLNVGERTTGALNLYSFSSDEISAETMQLAELFAAHAALALGHAERLDNLNAALASRKTIGLALGILMERLGIDEDRAFAYLTRISATTETKLRDVAAQVVEEVQVRGGRDLGAGGRAEPDTASDRLAGDRLREPAAQVAQDALDESRDLHLRDA